MASRLSGTRLWRIQSHADCNRKKITPQLVAGSQKWGQGIILHPRSQLTVPRTPLPIN
jgi:hypothetical protein